MNSANPNAYSPRAGRRRRALLATPGAGATLPFFAGRATAVPGAAQRTDEALEEPGFMELPPGPQGRVARVLAGGGARGFAHLGVLRVLEREGWRPDLVVGTSAGAIVGAMHASGLSVAHIEAGLRSFNRAMPEEINRVLTDHLSAFLFCPTDSAIANLRSEGIMHNVHNVGDIMYDAALHYGNRPDSVQTLSPALRNVHAAADYILATIHRQENTDDPLRLGRIVTALLKVADAHPVVLPLHPRTRSRLDATWLSRLQSHPSVHLTDPLGYLEMLQFERHARLVVTDSGGVQKEAFFFKVACATLRDQTEWTELVDHGWNTLIDVVHDPVEDAILRRYGCPGEPDFNPYGNGRTAQAILSTIIPG